MSILPVVNPSRVGISSACLQRAYDLLDRWQGEGEVPAAGLCVGRRGGMIEPRINGAPVDATFLVASVTKPVAALAALMLVERGQITLDDRVAEYLPDFAQNGKEGVRIRHLLTHTSGLPDQLPENLAMRAAHAPLSAFVEGACRQPLAFPQGTGVKYQSMGFAVLGAIVEKVVGEPLGVFLRREVFEPLQMHNTWLGCPPEHQSRIAPLRVDVDSDQRDAGDDWNWNSSYWRSLGAPWGGMTTTPADFARFCRMMLDEGSLGRVRIVGPATVRAMTTNQLDGFPLLSEPDRRCRPWGFGWRLNWRGYSANFGDLLGPRVFGHWGATGTLCWIDPDADAFCLIFTTRPNGDDGRYLARLSNIIAASLA